MINLKNYSQKRTYSSPDESSEYMPSALEEAPEQYVPPEESYSETEDQKETEELKPESPEEIEPPSPRSTRLEIPPAPIYPEYPAAPSIERIRKEEVESLIEQIIEEKWDTLTVNVGDINIWKEKVRTEIISIKQELLRLEHRSEEVNKAVLGKVSEYDKSIKSVGTDVKAIEKVLQKILQPLTTNIQELQRITQKLKK